MDEHIYTVDVPTEEGRTAAICVTHDREADTFTIQLTGEMLDQSREGIVAGVQMAFLSMRDHRRAGFARAR